ncbi:hypothetical protein O9X98_06670 [Agrobacterium salinitolerans]|nr:hypothetical protein [Agrobacterium salinitolerans]
MKSILNRSPITGTPFNPPKQYGWGLRPVAQWEKTVLAVREALSIVDSAVMPEATASTLESLSVIKGLFSKVYLTDQADWYSVSRLLGRPSGPFCQQASAVVDNFRQAIISREGIAYSECQRFLRDNYVAEMLENACDIAAGKLPLAEEGIAYIVWSALDGETMHIGVTEGEVEEVIKRLDGSAPNYPPHGVLASWLVHDPDEARQDIGKGLAGHRVGNGTYAINLGFARNFISGILARSENTVLSPWHDTDEVAHMPSVEVNRLRR